MEPAAFKVKVADFDTPAYAAVTVALWLEVTDEAVAVTAALDAPAATTTEAGSERVVLLSDNPTEMPPLGAGALRETLQVALPGVAMLVGLHEIWLSVGVVEPPEAVMVPPVCDVAMVLPVVEAAEVAPKVTDVLLTPEATCTFTTATIPFAIGLAFIPVTRHVYAPEAAEQFTALPAPVAALPATAEIEVMSAGAYFSVH